MKRILISLLVLLLVLALTIPALALGGGRGGGFGGGGRSGGGRSSGGSKGSGGSSKSHATPSKPTASKPSTGSKQQPKPVRTLIPATPPRVAVSSSSTTLKVPSGRSYSRDRQTIIRNPKLADPYNRSLGGAGYYGYYGGGFDSSPFFYLWLFSIMDNDRSNNPLPPEADGVVSTALLSYLQVLKSMAEVSQS